MNNILAQGYENPVLGGLRDESGSGFLNKFLPNAIGLAFAIGVTLFLIVMILGAIQWITSGGDKNAVEQARGKLTNAVVGVVILLASYVIIKMVEMFFGIDIIRIDIGALKIE